MYTRTGIFSGVNVLLPFKLTINCLKITSRLAARCIPADNTLGETIGGNTVGYT